MRARRVRRRGCSSSASSGPGAWRTSSSPRSGTRRTGYPLHERIRRDDRAHAGAARDLARFARALPPSARGGRALPQPCTRRDLPAHRGGEPRGHARAGARARAVRLVRGLRRRGDRPLLGRGGRPPHRRRHGRLGGNARAARRRSTTAGSPCARPAPGARAPSALQQLALLQGFDVGELSEAELVHVVTECAKLAFADRDALYGDADVRLDILLSDEYNDERRALVGEDRIGRVPARLRPSAGAARGGGDRRLGRAGPGHCPPRRRRPSRERRLGDPERGMAVELARDPRPSAGRSGRGRRCSGSRRGCRPRCAPVRARGRRSPRASPSGTESRTSRGERPAATSRSSGRCMRSSGTSTAVSTSRRRSTRPSSTPTT